MDEQRVQAYLQLIQDLLSCPSGEEPAVLQKNQSLIDVGLVEVMGRFVERLRQQGQEKQASFLEDVARQLLESSSMQTIITRPIETQWVDSNVMDFLIRVLQAVEQDPNPHKIYLLLKANLDKVNLELALALQIWADQMLLRFNPEQRSRIVRIILIFSDMIQGFPFNRSDVLEIAIFGCRIAEQFFEREQFPELWATAQSSLANAYSDRIKGERAQNIEDAIAGYKLALQVRSRERFPELWARTQNSLANAYCDRIKGERSQNLEEAISAYQLALQVRTRERFPEDWAMVQNNLATAYWERIQGERAQNIEDAIAGYKRALQIRTRECFPKDWAMTQNNMANAYRDRIRGERAQNIEDAIAAYERALSILTREDFPNDWAITQNNLSMAYIDRIRGERAQNIEDAIFAARKALQVHTQKQFPEDWAMAKNNLAIAYSNRIRGERAQNIEDAIDAYERSLQVRTQEHFPKQWAITQNNLSVAYRERIRGERAKNIEDAIIVAKRALQVRTQEQFPEEWAMTQMNLGNAYFERIRGERANNIEDAITAYKLSLKVRIRDQFPEQWAQTQNNLANSYKERIQGGREQNIETAILTYNQALEVYKPNTFPQDCRRTAKLLADLSVDNQLWQESLDAYQLALTATENLYQASISRFGQEAELKETNDLYRRAAYAYAKASTLAPRSPQNGKLKTWFPTFSKVLSRGKTSENKRSLSSNHTGSFSNSLLEQAITIFEQGRARGLSETLQRDRANLYQIEQQNPELFNRYQTAANTLRNLEAIERSSQLTTADRPQFNANQATQTRAELKACIAEIRQIPGYETFLALPTFADITQSLQSNRPLIYLTTTPSGSLALILTPTNTEPTLNAIWLDDLNEADLIKLLDEQWLPASRAMSQDLPNWLNTIDTVTRQLWDQVMQPIVDHLETHHITQATLIPTGYLSLLPLHAAWTEDPNNTKTGRRYACDTICFTTAPNARSLQAAQTVAQNTPVTNLLAVGNPTKDPGIHDFETRVTQVAAAAFPPGQAQILRQDNASHRNVLEAIPHYSVLQVYCHGKANFNEPLNSGLAMADNVLSLRDLFDLKLKGIRLAVLTACETGISGTELPDEVVSLPTGLLQAGVAGVAASLWSVNAFSTMLLTIRFYDLWRNDYLEPAAALHQAQLWLRDTTSYEKAAFFQTSHPELVLKLAVLEPDYFAHPFHWAAFTYTGV